MSILSNTPTFDYKLKYNNYDDTDEGPDNFQSTPLDLAYYRNILSINSTEFAILNYLFLVWDPNEGCYPTENTLAIVAGLTQQSVSRPVNKLKTTEITCPVCNKVSVMQLRFEQTHKFSNSDILGNEYNMEDLRDFIRHLRMHEKEIGKYEFREKYLISHKTRNLSEEQKRNLRHYKESDF